MEQGLRLVGETGQRGIGAHGADGFLALLGHGAEHDAEVFVGVAEGALAADQGLVIGAVGARRLGQLIQRDLVFLDPQLVGFAAV